MNRHAQGHRDLIVYQKTRAVANEIFALTKTFPREEMYSLTDQVRRSSRSVGAQITEAWAKRRYENHFKSKLTDADGEQRETQHWVDTAFDCGYIDNEVAEHLNSDLEEIGRMLNGMIAKAELFCGGEANFIREPDIEYFHTITEEQGESDGQYT